MPSFKKFYKENRKKAIQSQKNSVKLLQLLMILCSYNFIKFSMCSYNFNVAVRISINLYDIIANNICENQKLTLLRDTLLPKLMSGEIDVSDIRF